MRGPIDPRRIELDDEATVRAMRAMGPEARLRLVDQLVEFSRQLARTGVRDAHPDWSEQQVAAEVVRRVTGASN